MSSELDRAIVAYRENPSELNKRRLDRISAEVVRGSMRRDADEFIRRTR